MRPNGWWVAASAIALCVGMTAHSRGQDEDATTRTFKPGHMGPVRSVAFSPDGLLLASGTMHEASLASGTVKIWDAGHFLPDVERIILANSRQPELVRGDMRAQIAVTRMGVTRVKDLCGRFGTAMVTGAFAAILAGAADALRGAIRRLPA